MLRETVAQAVSHYHNLLEKTYLSDTVQSLEHAISERRLTVAGRPVCSVLRPHFIDSTSYEMVMRASTLVMRGFAELKQRLFQDSALRARLELTPAEEEIVLIDTGYGAADVSARLDGFLDAAGNFRFVEYNADSPGGIAFGDVLSEVFAALPVVREFGRRFPFRILPVRSRTWDALLSTYHRWGGRGLPSIAIVDWRTTATRNEFILMQEHFEARGCRVCVADPDELEYRNGKLYASGNPVDLVYKRLVVFELLERLGLRHPLVQAVKDHAVCMANGFAVQMLFKKSLFAMLNDPAIFAPRDPEVAEAVHTHVPWSRLVRECRTQYEGRTVDLVDFIMANRNRLVLKPSSEYGGRGVQLGWESSEDEWKDTLATALQSSYIVQERVNLGVEIYPSFVDGKLTYDERYFDLDPYVWHGERIDGCGVRLSRGALLNVSAGGGSATPLFVSSPFDF